METIRLIAGLGNPGPEHQLDRHNAGFWFADTLAHAFDGRFRSERRFNGELSRIEVQGRELLLFKPMTYMNRSGLALQGLCAYRKIAPTEVLVAHDELDLPAGTVRLKRGGGHGGHNGLRDTIAHLGKEFLRLRFGIGHPGSKHDVINYVLRRAPAGDEELILNAVGDAVAAVPTLLEDGEEKAKNRLHSRDAG
ncbi:MAG: aminoacyl-tRNA hydrolase [Gammaproteobacteria bacterium]|nr:aminoacyl-tRNA hydrolase [Gammaproteobacteria bacterium]